MSEDRAPVRTTYSPTYYAWAVFTEFKRLIAAGERVPQKAYPKPAGGKQTLAHWLWKLSTHLASVDAISTGGGGGGGSYLPLAGGQMAADAQIATAEGAWRGEGSRLQNGVKGLGNMCILGYMEQWVAGSRYVYDGANLVRETTNQFSAPGIYDDEARGFKAGSRWVTDDGRVWLCASAAEEAALWEGENRFLAPVEGGNIILQPELETNDASLLPRRATRRVYINENSTLWLPANGSLGQEITYHVQNNGGADLTLALNGEYGVIPEGFSWNPVLPGYCEKIITIRHNDWSWSILPDYTYYWD